MEGRCVPIHPGGGWHCGSGSNSGDGYVAARERSDWAFKDFTRPTKCPECGADVFFIRHNGGSVWVDELGWPWPKHACFDNDAAATEFTAWSAKASNFTNPNLGVITSIRPEDKYAEPVIELRMSDSTRLALVLRWTPPSYILLGSLVILSRKDNLLLHPTYGEIPFHSVVNLPANPSVAGKTLSVDEAIALAAERVAREAWQAVPSALSRKRRLSQAKLEALRIIRAIPSRLRGKVEYYFTSQKWTPLISREPKK